MAVIGTTPDDAYIIVEEADLTALQASVLAEYQDYQAWGNPFPTTVGYAQAMVRRTRNIQP